MGMVATMSQKTVYLILEKKKLTKKQRFLHVRYFFAQPRSQGPRHEAVLFLSLSNNDVK